MEGKSNFLFSLSLSFWGVLGFKDGCFVAGGCSLAFPELPPEEDLVRAWNHPGCMAVRPVAGQPQVTTFQWLLDCDYGGWVPQHVLDLALPFSQVGIPFHQTPFERTSLKSEFISHFAPLPTGNAGRLAAKEARGATSHNNNNSCHSVLRYIS